MFKKNKEYNKLVVEAGEFVFNLFKESDESKLLYHNYKHTSDVVDVCVLIGNKLRIKGKDREHLLIAAYFHDVGYVFLTDDHELESARLAEEFLVERMYPIEEIAIIKKLILSTKRSQQPKNLLEEIICDADSHAVGSDAYRYTATLLREERYQLKNELTLEQEWLEKEIEFLIRHKFYTTYATKNWNHIKSKNLTNRRIRLKQIMGNETRSTNNSDEQKSKKVKLNKPSKGIETMFRTSLKNHMELSAIADNKANIMLSISALILSIVISSLASKFDTHSELIGPTVFMLFVCLISIVLATLATNPKITHGKFSESDVVARKANLLFFGNFHKMSIEEYEWGMKEIMNDGEYLYSSLIRDLYSLGVVLARKYQFLRWCYIIFMYGMIVSVVYFGLSILKTSGVFFING